MRRSFASILASIIALALGHSPAVSAAGPVIFTVPLVDEVSMFEACNFRSRVISRELSGSMTLSTRKEIWFARSPITI